MPKALKLIKANELESLKKVIKVLEEAINRNIETSIKYEREWLLSCRD